MTVREKRYSASERAFNRSCLYFEDSNAGNTPMVSFVGTSNSGKTTLLEIIIRELKLKGYRVATIKHTHHDFDLDRPGKDSWRIAQAGSSAVALSSPNKLAVIQQVDQEVAVDQIAAMFKDKVDIILVEGYKNDHTPKILVAGKETKRLNLHLPQPPLMTITPHLSPLGKVEFTSKDVSNVTTLLVQIIEVYSPDGHHGRTDSSEYQLSVGR